MSRRFPHHLVITRPSKYSAQNDDTGALAAPAADVIYDDGADVQDMEGEVLTRARDGVTHVGAEAVAYLENVLGATAIKAGDNAVIRWEDGSTQTADVLSRSRIDARVFLQWTN